MTEMIVDGKKYYVRWQPNNMAAIDWHPDGWRVREDVPFVNFDNEIFFRGAKDMPTDELADKIRWWQKSKAAGAKFLPLREAW